MINKSSFNIEKELAEGSFGNVFLIDNVNNLPSSGQYVYKEYKSYARPDAVKLSSFVNFYYDLAPNAKDYLDKICSWPHEWVGDKGRVAGVLMPRIPSRFYCNINFSSGTKEVEAKFEHLLMPKRLLGQRQIPITNKKRYQLLQTLVKELDFLHENKICIGDFSHSNILFSLNDCRVFFLDCDSFRVKGDSVFPQTETGNWGVAERYPDEELCTEKSDIYKLGLLALRLLMNSSNPTLYQATKNTDYLSAHIDSGVKKVIKNSLKEEANRPSLAEWSSVLSKAIENCVEEVEVIESYASIDQQLTQRVIQQAVQQTGQQTAQQTYHQNTQYNNQPIAQQNKKSSGYNPMTVRLVISAIVCATIFFLVYTAHNNGTLAKVMNIVTQEESREVAESNRVDTNTEAKRKQNLEDVKASIISEDSWEDVTYNDNGDYVEFNLYSSYQIKGMANSDTGINYYDESEYTEKSGNTWAQNIASNLKSRVIMNLYNADGTLYTVIRSD